MSFDIEDLLDQYPELESFDIYDLENLDEFELQDLIDGFDDFGDLPINFGESLNKLSKDLKNIDFNFFTKTEVMEKYGLTEDQYEQAKDMREKIDQSERLAKPTSSDSGTKALSEGTTSAIENTAQFSVIFVTEEDDRVCPICQEFEGIEYQVDPDTRIIINAPVIPDDTHPNCRCRYMIIDSEEILGGSGDDDGSWITVNSSPVFIPSGANKGTAIKDHFEKVNSDKPKSAKQPFTVGSKSEKQKVDTSDKNNEVKTRFKEDIDKATPSKEITNQINADDGRIKQITDEDKNGNLTQIGHKYVSGEVFDQDDAHNAIFRDKGDDAGFKWNKAIDKEDYETSDKMFLDAVNSDPKIKHQFKDEYENVQGFNNALKEKAQSTPFITRFVEDKELDSYMDGKFDSLNNRKEAISFTVEKDHLIFGNRPVKIEVPTETLKDRIYPIEYTNFPRKDDHNSFVRSHTYMTEAEVKIPSGTDIPKDMRITFQQPLLDEQRIKYKEKYGHLGQIIFNEVD